MLAFYYAWYDESTWSSGITADIPLQPYRSSDVITIERHVNQAQVAGIDALIQSWYGPQETNNQTETNFRTLLNVAAGKGFHVAIAFETNGPFFPDQASVMEALRYLLAVHAQHPAYLRYQGKPVIFFWRQQRFSVDTWSAIRAELDPDHTSLWIAEGTDLSYQRVFDGHYLYSVAWSSNLARTLQDWGQRVQRYAENLGTPRLWVATVMPGYDDSRSGRAKSFAVDRRNGDYYRTAWSAAIASRPDWVVITSFNEWVEGTMIEPSARYGDLYLNLTRELAAQFKGSYASKATMPTPEMVTQTLPAPSITRSAVAMADGPYVRAQVTVRIRSGPDITFPRIGRLAQGEQAKVLARNSKASWWQIEVPRSNTLGWVSAAFVELLGDAGRLPVVELSTATPRVSPEINTATPTVTRYTVTSTATRTPALTRTVTVEATMVVSLTPAGSSRRTSSAQRQTTGRTPAATVPPFITPLDTSVTAPPSTTTDIPRVTMLPQPRELLAEVKTLTSAEPSPIATVSACHSPLEGNVPTGKVAIRPPPETTTWHIPSLLWAGCAALLAALVLLIALFVKIRGARHNRGRNRSMR